jgi:hypothetical protein
MSNSALQATAKTGPRLNANVVRRGYDEALGSANEAMSGDCPG